MSCDGYTPPEHKLPKWQKVAILVAIVVVVLVAIFVEGCAPARQTTTPKTVVLKIESEIPVTVSIYKNCEGNWNFCRYQ